MASVAKHFGRLSGLLEPVHDLFPTQFRLASWDDMLETISLVFVREEGRGSIPDDIIRNTITKHDGRVWT